MKMRNMSLDTFGQRHFSNNIQILKEVNNKTMTEIAVKDLALSD